MSAHTYRQRHRYQQRGLTLLELMVGLTIGMIVSTAAVGTLLFMQSSSRLTGEASRMQQDATLVFNLMGQYIRASGSVSLTQNPSGGISFVPSNEFAGIPGETGNPVVRGLIRSDNEVLQVAISTLGNSGMNNALFDCLGNNLPAIPTLLTEFSWDSTNRELRCGRGSTPEDLAGASAQPIVGNVAQFVLHYGLRTAENAPLQYRLREAVANTDWPLVQAVRVCMILTSQGAVDEFGAIFRDTNLPFDDCDSTDTLVVNRATIINDPQRRLYRLYRHVFTIRPAAA